MRAAHTRSEYLAANDLSVDHVDIRRGEVCSNECVPARHVVHAGEAKHSEVARCG